MRHLTLLLAVVFALPLAAQTEVGIVVGHSDAGATDADGTTLSFRHGRGFGATVERRWSEHASIELGAMWLRSDGTLRLDAGSSASLGRLKLLPVTAVARWHFAPPGERVDPYAGAGAAYVKASDLSSNDLEALGIGRIDLESKACWVANAGVAVEVSSGLALAVDGKMINYRPNSGPSGSRVRLELRPVVISAGIRWRR
jgi:outer membrane protein W